jgi:hypothetical protein
LKNLPAKSFDRFHTSQKKSGSFLSVKPDTITKSLNAAGRLREFLFCRLKLSYERNPFEIVRLVI